MTNSEALQRVKNVVFQQNENAILAISFEDLERMIAQYKALRNDADAAISPGERPWGIAFQIGREGGTMHKTIEHFPIVIHTVLNPGATANYMQVQNVFGFNAYDGGGGDNLTPVKIG